MNIDFIIDALDNFATFGGASSDILGGLGELFGEDGAIESLSSSSSEAVEPDADNTDPDTTTTE